MTIYDDRECFYQWDVDQKITSDTFKVGDTIHFANKDQIEALPVKAYMLDGQVVADVPNILLEASLPLKVWKYEYSEHSAQTTEEHVFDVKKRAKPSDHVYTETELYELRRTAEEATAKAIRTEAEVASAENERQIDELDREFNETERITAEVARVTAENERLTAETTRLSAEQARVSAESARIMAEQQRQSAETVRQTAFEQSYNSIANALKSTVRGEVIRVDDVSPIDHIVKVKASGKNLLSFDKLPNITSTYHSWSVNPSHETVTMSITDKDTNVDISGVYFGLCGNGVNADGGVVWLIKNGTILTTSAKSTYEYVSIFKEGSKNGVTATLSNRFNIQVEKGNATTDYEPYIDPTTVTVTRYGVDETDNLKTYTPSVDGTCDIASLSPTMTLLTDTEGVTIEAEYNRDINIVINDIIKSITELKG